MSSQDKKLDRWADWLLHGRQRGMSAAQVRRLQRDLRRMRDRVLRAARLRRGQRALDVGAGTGLIALEARRRVGPSGSIAALDVSADALRQCARAAASDGATASLHVAVGDALRLPFAGESFDAVFTRSVLIYVENKAAAARELHRVLKPKGRASIFEPINSASAAYAWNWGADLSPMQPAHDRIIEHIRANWEHQDTMMAFDERDLARCFVDAGFAGVRMTYEYGFGRRRSTRQQVALSLSIRGNPSIMSYEDATRALLGDSADDHLARLARLLLSSELAGVAASVYVVARK